MKVRLRPTPVLYQPRHRQPPLLQLLVEVPTSPVVDPLLAAASTTHAVVVPNLQQQAHQRKPLQEARDPRGIVRAIHSINHHVADDLNHLFSIPQISTACLFNCIRI